MVSTKAVVAISGEKRGGGACITLLQHCQYQPDPVSLSTKILLNILFLGLS